VDDLLKRLREIEHSDELSGLFVDDPEDLPGCCAGSYGLDE
jgi:hypothetical protein